MSASPLRVVLAEDGFSETGLTLRSLCAGEGRALELVRVAQSGDLVKVLRARRPDIALLKLALLQPDAGGQLRILRENSPSIPFILLAEPADNVTVESCVALGAADYLVEGYLDEKTMERVLRSAMGGSWRGELPAEQSGAAAGWGGDQEWGFTVILGDIEEMETWLDTKGVEQAVSEIATVLRKSVRSTDSVTALAADRLEVKIRSLGAEKGAAVQKRIETKLRNCPLLLLRELKVEIRAAER